MSKGERWVKFFTDKGWLKNNVIAAGEGEELQIFINMGDLSTDRRNKAIDSAMILEGGDILCYEGPSGSVFFQWDDIIQVKVEKAGGKKGWL
jgi:hypothetical protein